MCLKEVISLMAVTIGWIVLTIYRSSSILKKMQK